MNPLDTYQSYVQLNSNVSEHTKGVLSPYNLPGESINNKCRMCISVDVCCQVQLRFKVIFKLKFALFSAVWIGVEHELAFCRSPVTVCNIACPNTITWCQFQDLTEGLSQRLVYAQNTLKSLGAIEPNYSDMKSNIAPDQYA